MNILEYTKRHGNQELADAIGTSAAYISQLAHGHRRPGLRTIYRIVEATGGEVTAHDMRPDIFPPDSGQAAA